jgi:hypothetical protein
MIMLTCRLAGLTALSGAPPQHVVCYHPGEWFHQIVRAAVKAELALVKNHRFRGKARWINIAGLVDIPDIVGDEIQFRKMQRPGSGVDVGNVPVADCEAVDLEWIGALERVLPSFFAQRSFGFRFSRELSPVYVNFRVPHAHIRHQSQRKQFLSIESENASEGNRRRGGVDERFARPPAV